MIVGVVINNDDNGNGNNSDEDPDVMVIKETVITMVVMVY